jgi:hypothetical protein
MNYSLELAEDPVDKSHQMVGRRERLNHSLRLDSTFSRVQIAHLLFRINQIDSGPETLFSLRRRLAKREKQIKKPKNEKSFCEANSRETWKGKS